MVEEVGDYLENDVIVDFNVSTFIDNCWGNLVSFNPVTHRAKDRAELVDDPFVGVKCCRLVLACLQMLTVR